MTLLSHEDVPAVLQSTICPNCGYSLAGREIAQPCSECGREQNPTEIVLYGWARGHFENLSTAKPSRMGWTGFLGFGYLLFQGLIAPAPWRYVWFGAVVALVLYAIMRRHEAATPGQIQVRIYPHGCVQYNDNQAPTAMRNLLASYGWVLALIVIFGLGYWAWAHPRSEDRIGCWVGMGFATLLGVVGAIYGWQVRCARGWIGAHAIIDANAAFYEVVPWNRVESFALSRQTPTTYRLRIQRKLRFFWLTVQLWIVDAEVTLNESQVEALHQWLKGCVRSGWNDEFEEQKQAAMVRT